LLTQGIDWIGGSGGVRTHDQGIMRLKYKN